MFYKYQFIFILNNLERIKYLHKNLENKNLVSIFILHKIKIPRRIEIKASYSKNVSILLIISLFLFFDLLL